MKTIFQVAKEINTLLEENNLAIKKHVKFHSPHDWDTSERLVIVNKTELYKDSGSPLPGHTIDGKHVNI